MDPTAEDAFLNRPLRTRRGSAWFALRAVWSALLLLHLAPFAVVVYHLCTNPSGAALASFGALACAVTLFVLKAFDAPFLRLRHPTFEVCVMVLCGVLAHGHAVEGGRLPALPKETVGAAASLACGAVASTPLRKLLPAVPGMGPYRAADRLQKSLGFLECCKARLLVSGGRVLCLSPPRPPPLSACLC